MPPGGTTSSVVGTTVMVVNESSAMNSLENLTSEYTSSLSSIDSSIIQYLPLGTGRLAFNYVSDQHQWVFARVSFQSGALLSPSL